MNNLLYYPNFEIQDSNFLNFALLYLDEIRPIVPDSAQNILSQTMRDIMHDTNLIVRYIPDSEDGIFASIAAIRYLETCLSYGKGPYSWEKESKIFKQKDYTLYQEKFSFEFEQFCLENDLAERCNEGIKLNKKVAFIYMSILADYISKKNELDAITDCPQYADERIRGAIPRNPSLYRKMEMARTELEFHIPVDMRNVQTDKVIQLRASSKFEEARKHFVREYNIILEKTERGESVGDLKDYFSCKSEIYSMMIEAGIAIETVGLFIYSFANKLIDDKTNLGFLGGICGAVLTVGKLCKECPHIQEQLEKIKGKKMARNYLAQLDKLGYGVPFSSNAIDNKVLKCRV